MFVKNHYERNILMTRRNYFSFNPVCVKCMEYEETDAPKEPQLIILLHN